MTHSYEIKGMTCSNCTAKVKSELLKLGDVVAVDVQLQSPQATISMNKHIAIETLQQAIGKAGHYSIQMEAHTPAASTDVTETKTWLQTYMPLLLVFAFISGISLIASFKQDKWNAIEWMNYFMAGFFLCFSFFKLLNIRGFADSYSSYDILAKQWYTYGLIYPFIELGLGIAYLAGWNMMVTNTVTIVVMGFSSIGVIQAVTNKRKIQCACLGAVFNLPMSTVTIMEDLLMVIMAAGMLVLL